MSDIKLPMMHAKTYGATSEAKTNISSSALYKYLGWSKSRRKGASATNGVLKNGVPLLLYLDIFKNFFANTQEKKFYMLKGAGEVKLNLTKTYNNENEGIYIIGKDQQSIDIINTTQITVGIITDNYRGLWESIKMKILTSDGALSTKRLSELTTNPSGLTITLNNVRQIHMQQYSNFSRQKKQPNSSKPN